jgi:hypothetical protein
MTEATPCRAFGPPGGSGRGHEHSLSGQLVGRFLALDLMETSPGASFNDRESFHGRLNKVTALEKEK